MATMTIGTPKGKSSYSLSWAWLPMEIGIALVLATVLLAKGRPENEDQLCQSAGGEEDHMSNMSSAATIFLVLSIAIGMVFGMSTYAIMAGALMLILVAIVHFTGILPE